MHSKIKIKIEVKRPNELLKKLMDQKINLYEVTQNEKNLVIVIDSSVLETITKSKMIKSYKIIEDYGKIKMKRRLRKYKIICLSALLGILLNIGLSKMIFQVEIKMPNQKLKQQFKKDLYFLGLKPLRIKPNIEEINQIKKKMLLKEKDKIEWLEIENHGTKYIVTIEEKKEQIQESCFPRNIVAKKNAMITKIESSSGEIIKKKYDYVEKGEVIISGVIHNKEDIVSNKCAEGKVSGETWYKVIVEIPEKSIKTKKTDKYKWHLTINYGNNIQEDNKWLVLKEYNIISSKIYPFNISLMYLQKVNKTYRTYTIDNVNTKAFQEAKKTLEQHLLEKPNIIKKKVLKKSIKNSKIIVEVFFALEEDITSYQSIQKEEAKER